MLLQDYSNRFQVIPITPRQLVDVLDCDHDRIHGIKGQDGTYSISSRFYRGLASQLGIPMSMFGLFSPYEVLLRAAERRAELGLRMTVDLQDKVVLGLTEDRGLPVPVKYIVHVLAEDSRIESISYSDGMIEAYLALGERWSVSRDSEYSIHVRCRVPVDGLGVPDMTLSILRMVCSNGAVAEASLFKTKMELRDNSGDHFRRLLQSFNNPEGVELLRERVGIALETKASVGEVLILEGIIRQSVLGNRNQVVLRERLYEIAENPCVRYGVVDLSRIGVKKRALLPVGCSVADLINFASELSTHHADVIGDRRPFQVFAGTVYSKGFDLEDLYPNTKKSSGYYLRGLELVRE